MKKTILSLPDAYGKLYKLYNRLQQIRDGKLKVSYQTFRSLIRQWNRGVRKAISRLQPAAKMCSVFALSVLLSKEVGAQCNVFSDANQANPITIKNLPHTDQPYFVDIDGDGDLDCYALDYISNYDAPFFFKNVGTNKLPLYKYMPAESGFPLGESALGFASTNVQFVDIDGDGDYDCFLAKSYGFGSSYGVNIKYFENTGTATHPHFEENEANNPLRFAGGSYFINFTLADIDGDGDYDLYLVRDHVTASYRNTGTKTHAVFVYVNGSYTLDANAGDRVYYDWNKDGLIDYINQDYLLGNHYYKNIGPENNPQYVIDDANGPQFQNGYPHVLADLNGDGVPESFDGNDNYSSVAPVPLIDTATVNFRGKSYAKLTVSPTNDSYAYQWYKNGIAVAGAVKAFYIAFTNGVYSVAITDSCSSGFSQPYRVKYSNGFADEISSAPALSSLPGDATDVKVFPNPFNHSFTLQPPPGLRSGYVQVTDIQGKLLVNQPINSQTISLGGSFAKGMYLLQIISDNKVIYTKKLMKE